MLQSEIVSNSPADTEYAGEELAKELLESGGGVVAFFGDLGVGKTAFVRGMCRAVGYKGDVTSPTFAIVHEYIGGKLPVYHFDMYRVSGPDDLYSCGFYDFLGKGILAIEWSENIEDVLPENAVRVEISYGGGNKRIIRTESGAKE